MNSQPSWDFLDYHQKPIDWDDDDNTEKMVELDITPFSNTLAKLLGMELEQNATIPLLMAKELTEDENYPSWQPMSPQMLISNP